MTVYLINVRVSNYESYEDYRSWSLVHKIFSTKEKAIEYINNEDNLKSIIKKDENSLYHMGIDHLDIPLQIKMRINENDLKTFDAWPYDEIFSEDGNEIIGYKPCENPSHWDMAHYEVSIVEWEVED